MDCVKGVLCFSKTIQMEEEWSSYFLENGSKLLEGLLAASNGKYGVPYRNFTAKELIRATNNFTNRVMDDGTGSFFRGCFQDRQILVKISHRHPLEINSDNFAGWHSYTINDIVISLQMSHHKNVFKLLGCCLEFKTPALVFEYNAGNARLLSDILHHRRDRVHSKDLDISLSWSARLKLAVDIANALVYLHSAFTTPIIHRDLCTRNIVIFPDGVAKLLDFSLCISLPPGESHVEDCVVGVTGCVEPEYGTSGIITEKTGVYKFGVLLLELLTGEKPLVVDRKCVFLVNHVEEHFVNNQVDSILDPILVAEKEESQQVHEQQMQEFAELALRCTRPTGKDRPDMISVAKELTKIMRSFRFS